MITYNSKCFLNVLLECNLNSKNSEFNERKVLRSLLLLSVSLTHSLNIVSNFRAKVSKPKAPPLNCLYFKNRASSLKA